MNALLQFSKFYYCDCDELLEELEELEELELLEPELCELELEDSLPSDSDDSELLETSSPVLEIVTRTFCPGVHMIARTNLLELVEVKSAIFPGLPS